MSSRAIGVDAEGWRVVESGARLRLIDDGELSVRELDSRVLADATDGVARTVTIK